MFRFDPSFVPQEHEVSLESAKNITDVIDLNKYEVVLVGIDRKRRYPFSDRQRFAIIVSDCLMAK